MDTTTESKVRLKLPGFGLPLHEMPAWAPRDGIKDRFPHAIADFTATKGATQREIRMLGFVDQISDKPDWDRKVFDDSIVEKWRKEAEERPAEDGGDVYMSKAMFDFAIAELRHKAHRYQQTRLIRVWDTEVTIVKSDGLVPPDLRDALRHCVQALEAVPDSQKDWHPGSGQTVLDLVHPSLYPLVYGRTRVLPHGTVPLEDCCAYACAGETVPTNDDMPANVGRQLGWGDSETLPAWGSYQWLPADVYFSPEGGMKIKSYIPSLHPSEHRDLYGVLERLAASAIPLWNETLSGFYERKRFTFAGTAFSDDDYVVPDGLKFSRPRLEDEEGEGPVTEDDSDFDFWDDEYRDWKKAHQTLTWPEPDTFASFAKREEAELDSGTSFVDLREKFAQQGLQVIFKLANIHLTPDTPVYEGGSWHVEGALNEHICATALYYYDQENITDSRLSFRQAIDVEHLVMMPAQNEYHSLEAYYGIEDQGSAVQDLGSVLTREGRMLAFPNTMQHRVDSFKLQDDTKPGYRKILAMFLVDPHVRVLSTANVPPQRVDWWATEVRKIEPLASLPRELFDQIIEAVDGFPMSWDDALEIRLRLMDERGAMMAKLDDILSNETFFFCEH